MSLIKFLLFRNKKTSVLGARKYGQKEHTEPKETSVLAYRQYGKDVDISISQEDGYLKSVVADYYTINEYVEKMREIDKLGIEKLLNNSVVWNSGKQRVNKGTYFVFDHNGSLYNILINDEVVKIDERHILDKQTFNSVVTFYNNSKTYDYFTCVHDENGSTYDTRYYSYKGHTTIKGFEMTKSETIDDWIFITRSLKTFKAIDKIIDIAKLDKYIFINLDEYLFDKKVDKMI